MRRKASSSYSNSNEVILSCRSLLCQSIHSSAVWQRDLERGSRINMTVAPNTFQRPRHLIVNKEPRKIHGRVRILKRSYISDSNAPQWLPNILTVTKSRGMRFTDHVARVGTDKNVYINPEIKVLKKSTSKAVPLTPCRRFLTSALDGDE